MASKKSRAKKVVRRNASTQLSVDQDTAQAAVQRSPIAVGRKTVVRAGPRGFRFGSAYLASVSAGKGVATRPSNLPKLLSLAAAKGVDLPKRATLTQKEIAELVAKAL